MDDYDFKNKEIYAQIKNLENSTKESSNNLKQLYDNFLENNKKFLNDITRHMKAIENNNLFSDSNILAKNIKLLNNIKEVYTQIYESIKKNLELMSRFLNNFVNLQIDPIQYFLSQELNNIIDSWILLKLDYDKFNIKDALNKTQLDDSFKNFILTNKKYNPPTNITPTGDSYTPTGDEEIHEETPKGNSIEENRPDLVNLHLHFVNENNVDSILKDKSGKIISIYLENSNYENPEIFKKMEHLQSLTLKAIPRFTLERFPTTPSNLKELYIEKNYLVDYEFNFIIKNIIGTNENLLAYLEVLSFACNNLSRVDLSDFNSKILFNKLKVLNFKKNKITKILCNPSNFPSLKFINCCKNILNKSYFDEKRGFCTLESVNGFLSDPELCNKYYNSLKNLLIKDEKDLYIIDYLNISFMPKVQSLTYFENFVIKKSITNQLRKLDLSYNSLNCDLFFKFAEQNQNFENLSTLNLNGNEIDDTFFETMLQKNVFNNLEHLYLNSNNIGDMNVAIKYTDNVPIDKIYTTPKAKNLIFKLRFMYIFIKKYNKLTKLTITKNPISQLYTCVQKHNADTSDEYIKRDNNHNIIINCLFSFLIKIRDELLKEEKQNNGRNNFNLRFDCRSNVNRNSDGYPYSDKPFDFIGKKKK